LAGLLAARIHGGSAAVLVPVSIGLSVIGQMGDLAESLAKRHFRVKDSSGLIPGHGGLLDRLDSVLTAGAVQALLTASVGASPLVWRSY
jgi:phosphatidate cytidylyltransferase